MIQGFGNVGRNAARILYEKGYKIIAVSDSKGGILNNDGLDIHEVMEHKDRIGTVTGIPGNENITNEELLISNCDILIPAALSKQLTINNANDVKAKVIVELANAPTTIGADGIFFDNDVIVIPDILANAGGVIVSYFEWSQNLNNDYWEEDKVLDKLSKTMSVAFGDVYLLSSKEGCNMRKAALQLAVRRILHAERLRGNL
ncbi:MAG: hypothetical protein K8R64_08450 [Methanosarcinaceae archaeon]|nr:hypothetical protein [Methanosarcinaceae archaeon]